MRGKKEGSLVNSDANPSKTVITQNPTGYDTINPKVIETFANARDDRLPPIDQYM